MAYAHVQSKIAKATGVTSLAVTFNSANTTNNRILAVAGTAFLSQTYTCADDASPSSNTYTQDNDYSDSFNQHSHFFSANITNGGGSARTVTFTPSASGDLSTIIAEYSGLSTATGSSAVDTTGQNFVNSAGTTVSVTASPNPTLANECAVAFFNDHAGNTYTATSGTIRVQGLSNEGQCCLIDVASVVGTTTLTATVSANGNWDHENMVVYKLAPVVASGAMLWPAQIATRGTGPAVLRYLFRRQMTQTNIATPTNTEFVWPVTPANRRGPRALKLRFPQTVWPLGTFRDTSVIPGTASLTLTAFTPSVTATANVKVIPGTASLVLTAFTPTVSISDNKKVIPGTASLTLTGYAPTISVSDNKKVIPGTGSLTLTAYAPTVTTTANVKVIPGTANLVLTGFAPTVLTPRLVTPGKGSLVLTGFAPTVSTSNQKVVIPGTASLALTGFAPTVSVSNNPTGDTIGQLPLKGVG